MVHLSAAVARLVGMAARTVEACIGGAVDAGVAGGAVAGNSWLSVMVLRYDCLCTDHSGVAGFAISVREKCNPCCVIARMAVKAAVEAIRVRPPRIMVRIGGVVPLPGMAVAAGKTASDRRVAGVTGKIVGAGEIMMRLSRRPCCAPT